ncbi:MAG: hypothetical protein HXN00_00145 [Porphyromonadaceae bacterium]|nr:hypothetical protein [Porphyromonadaceae bacterium]FAA03824.1 MAG TPA: hypothetical protein [Siphovirus LN-2020-2]
MSENTVATTVPTSETVEDETPIVAVNWTKLGAVAKKSARYVLPAAAGFAALVLVKALANSSDSDDEAPAITDSEDDVVDAELVEETND